MGDVLPFLSAATPTHPQILPCGGWLSDARLSGLGFSRKDIRAIRAGEPIGRVLAKKRNLFETPPSIGDIRPDASCREEVMLTQILQASLWGQPADAAPESGAAGGVSSGIRGIGRRIAEWAQTCADDYAAAAIYRQLSALSDAELLRRGLSRSTLAYDVGAAFERSS
jgi:hypothetical protein